MLEFLTQSPDPLHALLDFIFPSLCSGCGKYDDSTNGFCGECQRKTIRFSQAICLNCEHLIDDKVSCDFCGDNGFPLISLGEYSGPLRKAIVSFKYQGVVKLCPWVAGVIFDTFKEEISALGAERLIPIPLHPSREYLRGFNQSLRFANELTKKTDLPVDDLTLIRVKHGKPQAKLRGVKARRANVAGAFSVTQSTETKAKVILVDDVVTTGLTIMSAKKTLERAGFRVVGTIAIAHHSILSEPPKRRAESL